MNHRGEMFKHNKPTIPEQIRRINPPRSFAPVMPEVFRVATDTEEMAMEDTRSRKRRQDIPTSSTQPLLMEFMDESSTSKRASPETKIEPRGKTGRPKIKNTETRPDAEKREGNVPDEAPRKNKKRNKKKTDLALLAVVMLLLMMMQMNQILEEA